MYSTLSTTLLALATTASAYTWPDLTFDSIEEIYVNGLGGVIPPCDTTIPGGPGIQTAADWLRTAYHDMATADVSAGTGGIDASIGFETNRSENVGAGFGASLGFFNVFQTPAVSMADLIALGAIVAVKGCGLSVDIPFRYGRVDATEAGPPGVPEPQQDLATHTSIFERQGFNQTEMIGLVACGHTIGGVHGEDFPDITAHISTPANTLGKTVHFDGTFDNYDNTIATEFVANTSQDPLLIGPDETNSDHRIFNADGGALLQSFADSNDLFLETCQILLERMVNTVPKTVYLSDPLVPLPVKPENLVLIWNDDGSMQFSGQIRVLGNDSDTQVSLHINSRDGSSGPITPATFTFTQPGAFTSSSLFSFNQTIQVDKGISSFTVELKKNDNSTIADNGGKGFPVSDDVVFQVPNSCINSNDQTRNLVFSVRDGANLVDLSSAWSESGGSIPGTILQSFKANSAPAVKGAPIGTTGYTTYSSSSTFNGFLPDFSGFGGTYDVTAKDTYGNSVKIVGPPVSNIPPCKDEPSSASPSTVQNPASTATAPTTGSNKLFGAVENGSSASSSSSDFGKYAPILLGLLVAVAFLLIILIGMVIALLVRGAGGEKNRRMPEPKFRPLRTSGKDREAHEETESFDYQNPSGRYADDH